MRFRLTLLCVLAVLLLTGPQVDGQVATGIYNFGAFDSKGFDTINLGNLDAHFSIPIFSKAGRGGMNFHYNLVYDSAIWTPVGAAGSQSWLPSPTWGWTTDASAITGFLSYGSVPRKCFDSPPGWYWSTIQTNFEYVDKDGGVHDFSSGIHSGSAVSDCSTYGSTGFTITANDGSGLILDADGIDSYRISYPNGKEISPVLNARSGSASITDTNGNMITTSTSGFTDTTGTTVVSLSGSGTSASPRVLTYPTYLSTGASTASVTVHYASYNVLTNFGCSGVSEYSATGQSLVNYVQLADGQQYQFAYEATPSHTGYITGRLATITLPGGGRIQYAYSGGSNGIECQDGGTATLTRTMPDDSPSSTSWSYTRTPGTSGAANTHTEVVDGVAKHATYDFVNDSTDFLHTPYIVSHSQYNGAVTGTPMLAELTCYNGATTCVGQSLTLPIASSILTATLDNTSVRKTTQSFNAYSQLTAQTDYDYGSGSPGSQIHAVSTTYSGGLPTTVSTYGNSTSPMQVVTYGYDGTTPTSTSGLPQHTSAPSARGNLTSVSVATSTSTSIQTQTNTYDDTGQLKSTTDPAGNATTFAYDSGTDTFATTVTLPTTGSVSHSTGATYNAATGLMLTSVDQNGNTINFAYDSMLRSVSISRPNSTTFLGWLFTYSLASTSPYVTTGQLHSGTTYINSTNHLDGYGRVTEVETTDTPSSNLVDSSYDANGQLSTISNPYQTGATPVNTQTGYDALGRVVSVLDSDGSSRSTTYSGNAATTVDEASKRREIITDALGRTAQVLEPDGSNSLTLETDYQYDQNQTSGSGSPETYQTIITQKGGSSSSSDWRIRIFTYDTLGRMLTSVTPEAGTIGYTYPVSGSYCAGDLTLTCTRTDANTTKTTYAYDALNRMTGKTYSGTSSPGTTIASNTSAVSYYYDQTSYNGLTITNGNGLRTGMSDGSGATAWSYNADGSQIKVRKTVNGVTEQANYTRNSDQSVNTLQDFGGTTLTYSYDVAGRPTQIVDGSSNTYASSAIYNPAGQLTSLNHQLTSGGGAYVRSWSYNSRLQPSTISAMLNGTTPVQSLTYGYGTSGTNNGNVLSVANGMDSSRSETYTYDNLNRVKTGTDGHHWGETYTYDNWGNLYETTRGGGYSGGNNWTTSADAHNQLANQTYDSAGQVTQDEHGNIYSYDAEGKLLSAGGGTYLYDGDGNRVKKTASSTVTLYWPVGTSVLDESDSTGSTMAKQVMFGGMKVWSETVASGGRFLLGDHLGSIRITGDASGNLKDDLDYRSFGSVLPNYGTSPSDNHFTFTGYESDQSESATDYAVSRNLSTSMGRFNRPDQYEGSYDSSNPQSLNRYSYVQNRATTNTDRTGQMMCNTDADGNCGPEYPTRLAVLYLAWTVY